MRQPRRWKKSSFTGEHNCVELASTLDAVRDSKNPHVNLDGVDVRALVDALRRT
jgi:hypothetical protein